MPDTRVVLASRSVAFHEADLLSRFDPSISDEWPISTPALGGSPSSSPLPQVHAASPLPVRLSPQEGLLVCHFDSDSTNDDIDPSAPFVLDRPSETVVPTPASPSLSPPVPQLVSYSLDHTAARPSRVITPNVRLPAAEYLFPQHGYQLPAALVSNDSAVDPISCKRPLDPLMRQTGLPPFSPNTTPFLVVTRGTLSACPPAAKLSDANGYF
jgi:hypothetical protein